MNTQRIESKFIDSNVFVVSDGKNCVVIDAGSELSFVEKAVGNLKVLGVFLTHGHYDHSFYALSYAEKFGCKIYASKFAKEYLEDSAKNYSEGHFEVKDFSNFQFLGESGKVTLENFVVEYKQLGGHSKSDMMFKIQDEIFVGDVLIGRDLGRTDLFGGDKEEMKKSLKFLVDENYAVMHSGHGVDNTKQSQDKVAKLWLKFLSR